MEILTALIMLNETKPFSHSDLGKKSTLHIADECFSNFGVSMMYPLNSVYANLFNEVILRFAAAGLDLKISNDLEWDLQRAESDRLLDTKKSKSLGMGNVQERKLNLADTEGMFLLMAIGYIIAGSVLFSEIVGGCAKSCRTFLRRSSVSESRRGSTFSASQPDESRTLADKLKHKLRRRLQSKSKHHDSDDQNKSDEPSEQEAKCEAISIPEKLDESEKVDKPEKLDEPEKLKGITSFCTLKRIMMMRKQRKEQKKAAQKEMNDEKVDVTKESQANQLNIDIEDHVEIDDGAIAGEVRNITIEKEKCGEIDDTISLNGSSSMCSDPHAIKEETEVEVNQLSVDSDRENNPSKEFGELV